MLVILGEKESTTVGAIHKRVRRRADYENELSWVRKVRHEFVKMQTEHKDSQDRKDML